MQHRDVEFLITAEEAFPAFENLWLNATRRINAGFRVFSPMTLLRSDEGRAIGRDWFDLIVNRLDAGVRIDLQITDFDPIVRPDMHRLTWRSVRQVVAAGEASNHPELLSVRAALHPARVGIAPRVLLWPKIVGLLSDEAERLNGLSESERERALWDGPILAEWLEKQEGGQLRARRWPIPPLVPTTHHQKIASFDGETLYIGGLDLNERRFDTPEHQQASEGTWHDVQVILRGKAAADADRHLDALEATVAGKIDAVEAPRLLRTLSRKRRQNTISMSPHTLRDELAQAHYRAADEANELIYLESQFFRDQRLAERLARAARRAKDLSLVLVLPGAPEEVAFENSTSSDSRYGEYLQARCVEKVRDAFGDRCTILSPAQHRRKEDDDRGAVAGASLIYLHAKVSTFDDRLGIVSSANLNGRSFRWDTEAGVSFDDPETVVRLRDRCLAHWLPSDPGEAHFDPATAAAALADLAKRNAEKAPKDRAGFLLPYPLAPAKRFGRNLPGVPEEMV